MTTAELDALPPYTRIYLPSDWDVTAWEFIGRVADRNFYTLLHPPDADGSTPNRRPVYVDAPTMLNAVLDEQTAWLNVVEGMSDRMAWIYRFKVLETVTAS